MILSHFVFGYFQKKSLINLVNLETILVQEKTSQRKDMEKEILFRQKKINDFSTLLSQHLMSSNFFKVLEALTHPNIWFSEVSLDSDTSKVIISGETEDFQTLGQQLIIFQEAPAIIGSELSQISIGRGRIQFTFLLSLDPQVFKPR